MMTFLGTITSTFKQMDNSFTGKRNLGLTSDTSNALHQTLTGLVELIKILLEVSTFFLGSYKAIGWKESLTFIEIQAAAIIVFA